ncbi:serologically defined colon cancer antigen 3 [Pteropus alecto]|uniref:serologically defined colon cancer antigen 3 n=1 Tax=Pteropus alecto TaxID=9402 RepID=UPI000D535340|nr:serologically defined colon cancer antigen 3 [Pteropus alecto]
MPAPLVEGAEVGAGRCPLAGGAKVQVRRPRRAPAPARGEVALIVIPAPAFYERRSCLPQLDCERPHGRDLDSHFFGIRPTFMCYVPSPVLASVGDTDDKLEELEEANPFSFKEFLKTKNLSLSKDDTANRLYSKEATRHSLGLNCSSPTSQTAGFGLEYQQPFFEDPTGAGDLLDEDEDEDDGWNGAYLPSAVEQTHSSRVAASTSPCSTYISFFSSPSELVGPESLPPWTLSDSDSRVSAAGSPSADFAAHGESLGDRHLRTLQISYEALKDENSKLRRKLTEVQSFSETQTEMVRTLERKLEAKMLKEESDYHDLESVVQQAEQNLELMTKRAVKAENHVMKLKQEMSLLQAQVSTFKRENEALRCGQGASLTVVKQNTEVALQNLRMVMNSAHSSIKQLVSGAETLNLVAEILKSIDRISEIKDQEEA